LNRVVESGKPLVCTAVWDELLPKRISSPLSYSTPVAKGEDAFIYLFKFWNGSVQSLQTALISIPYLSSHPRSKVKLLLFYLETILSPRTY
jgi:hypothetical protein